MATTEILQFGSGGSGTPNVLSQADYVTFLSTLAGNSYGDGAIPSAKQFNKVLRQASFMSAGLANWMVSQGITVADDGNLSALVAEIQAAMDAYINASVIVPVGLILPFGGSTVPTGWLAVPTAVTNISRTTYAALFAVVGTLWGAGDGSTTFGMPYIPTDKVAVQVGAGTIGSSTAGVMPAHQHLQTIYGSLYSGTVTGGGVDTWRDSTTALVTAAGSGTDNLPAGMRTKFIVKY